MAPGLLRIVGGGGSLPHPPCAASGPPPWPPARSCPIGQGSPATASPVCWVLLGVGTQAGAGLAGFFQLRVAPGGTHTPGLTHRCRPGSPSRVLPDRQGQRHAPAAVIAIPAYTGSVLVSYARSLRGNCADGAPQRQPHRSVQHGHRRGDLCRKPAVSFPPRASSAARLSPASSSRPA